MPSRNQRQCFFPAKSQVLWNDIGTAHGFYLHEICDIYVFPGVPGELAFIYERHVERALEACLTKRTAQKLLIKTIGLSEAALDESVLQKIAPRHPIRWETQATDQGVFLKFYPKETQKSSHRDSLDFAALEKDLHQELGAYIYATQHEDLLELLARALKSRTLRLGVMESCTGGLLAKLLTDRPGSSTYFQGGIVAYSNALKVACGVSQQEIKRHGAVSEAVAKSMALAVQKWLQVDIGLAVTGIAGPEGASPEKPLGLVYSAMAFFEDVEVWRSVFLGSRDDVRKRASYFTLSRLLCSPYAQNYFSQNPS